ncbi:hypothetical protein AG1IA_02507 [Rhizoctonia solani AG-1 IA]|uniref:Uncharacterized protein n=1 Tax=Thanatephorus cucumeris (strain AG1-IA) TaxID=983506 RepID=L8WZD5_THACA|nr:hypothetical protein AG1IA_02507 [Rhizoctonia solani AG-1 IA]
MCYQLRYRRLWGVTKRKLCRTGRYLTRESGGCVLNRRRRARWQEGCAIEQ